MNMSTLSDSVGGTVLSPYDRQLATPVCRFHCHDGLPGVGDGVCDDDEASVLPAVVCYRICRFNSKVLHGHRVRVPACEL
jgi:hypothetical protein